MNMISTYYRFPLLVFIALLASLSSRAQSSSCLKFELPLVAANLGDTVALPLRVYDFDSILTMQFSLGWLPGSLEFISLEPGTDLNDLSGSNFNILNNHLLFAWFDQNLLGVTLPDSTILFTLYMKAINPNPNLHAILIDDSLPTIPIEVTQKNGPGDYSLPVAYEVGGVYVMPSIPYDPQIRNTCISGSANCAQPQGTISVDVTGGIPPYSFNWTGPNGFTSTEQNLDSLPPGIYYFTAMDQIASVAAGVFKVVSGSAPVELSSEVTPASCIQTDGCIEVTAYGGTPYPGGDYAFVFQYSPNAGGAPLFVDEAGNATNFTMCDKPPGYYFLVVTDAAGCTALDTIHLTGGDSLALSILTTTANCAAGQPGSIAVQPLNGVPPYLYAWSTGASGPVIPEIEAGLYTVIVTDFGGCTGTGLVQIDDVSGSVWGLQLVPVCPGLGNPDGEVLLLAGNPSAIHFPAQLNWSNGTTTVVPAPSGDTLDVLHAVPAGFYSVEVVDSLGCSQTLATSLNCFGPPPPDSANWVWPGDADDNNAVNHHDLLYLGLAFGATGPARPNASLNWTGQPAPDWPQSTTQRPVNYKNLDTNGDGLIGAADTLAIVANWGNIIDPATDNPFAAPAGVPGMLPAPALHFAPDTFPAGQTVAVPVLLGDVGMPADSMLGLAFSISYNPKILQPLYFEPLASWFGDPATDLLCIQRHYPGQHRLDVALVRNDGAPADGFGIIGRTLIVIEDDIFLRKKKSEAESGSGDDDMVHTRLFITNVHALTPSNNQAAIAAEPTQIAISQTVGTTNPGEPALIKLMPNPVSDRLSIRSPETPMLAIRVFDALGRGRLDMPELHASSLHIPVSDWAQGTYFVQIWTKNGVTMKTFVCQK